MRVLLLKEPREGDSGPDPYVKVLYGTCHRFSVLKLCCNSDTTIYCFVSLQELASYGHTAKLIPVLSFKLMSLNTLLDKVNTISIYNYAVIHILFFIKQFMSHLF